MKPISVPSLIAFITAFFTCSFSHAQNINISASAVWMTDFSQDTVFNVTGTLGNPGNIFTGANFGVHIPNSHTLVFRGGQLTAHSTSGASDVCSGRMYYRVYAQGGTPGIFNEIDFFFGEDCEFPPQFNSGGSCSLGDQKFDLYLPDGSIDPYGPMDLTTLPVGNYVIEVYYAIDGLTDCAQTVILNNAGANYKASFSIQNPTLSSTNPTTCNGIDGTIIINGLMPNGGYLVSYTDDGNAVGPNSLIADGSGQIIISGLNAGIYSGFKLVRAGNVTNLTSTVTLSNPGVIPKFKKIDPFCAGSTPPVLLTTSQNGVTGKWNPAIVDNQTSNSYQFTPDAGQCASSVSIDVIVIQKITPTFNFGTTLTLCAGATPPSLYKPSDNGITGTWSPSTINNQTSGTYIFVPNPNQCANEATFAVTVNPNITPSFSFGTSLTICVGTNTPALPTTSVNGISGTWSPATVDNQNSGTYTFTPGAGQCATAATFNVTVNPVVTPVFSFGPSLSICAGGSVPSLPTTSVNGVNGTWSPSIVNNQLSGVYTFAPSAGACAPSVTFTVTVTPNLLPTFSFGTALTICAGGSVPVLSNTSANGIAGTWSPSTIDNQNSGIYTFSPNAGQCGTTTSFSVTVNPNIIPVFSFGTALTFCEGASVPSLITTSDNGISGTWSPSVIDNQNPGTYTFTPTAGQCATSTSVTVTVNSRIIPAFGFGTSLTICEGASVPILPSISDNGINGTWSPSTVSNQNSGTYTFTSSGNQCATSATFTVTVNPVVTPIFSFGTTMNMCAGATVPLLPAVSDNGIAGTWSPSSIDNRNAGTYTFTPVGGQCITSTSLTVTVNSIVTPVFDFGTAFTICAGSNVPVLPTNSTNGISGTWNPGTIDNQNSATYTFTPGAGQCAVATVLNVTVNSKLTPTFSFGTSLTICVGGTVPTLSTTSLNGISGTWAPAVVSNQASGTYTFTPGAGQCVNSTNFVVTVNQNVPVFNFGTSLGICIGGNVPTLPVISDNGITGSWSPSVINNQASGSYTFTPNAGQCASTITLNVTITAIPAVDDIQDITVTDGSVIPAPMFTGSPGGVSFSWTNSNSFIGLDVSGTGNVPSFTAINPSDDPIKGTITVTPVYNGCTGAAKSYVITVVPLNKELFIANVFTPNGDGRNDIFYARGNYIHAIEMRIFNQYGRQIELITDQRKGWDGKYKGVPQPVGVYMYTLKATMTDGRIIQMKGNVTLLR